LEAVVQKVGRYQEVRQSASTAKCCQEQVKTGNAGAVHKLTADELTEKETVTALVRFLPSPPNRVQDSSSPSSLVCTRLRAALQEATTHNP
jgi:hypothetical protein